MTLTGRMSRLLTISTLAAAILTPSAHAQDSLKADTVHNFTGVVNLGFVNSSGNTNVTTLTIGDELALRHKAWTFKQTLGYVYGKNDSVETANQLAIGVRGERAFGKRWGVYVGLRYYRDPFAGISQRFGEQTGALYHAIIAPKDLLDFEVGLGLTQERSVAGVNHDFPNGRAALMYKHSWAKKTYFQETAEWLPNLQDSNDYRVNSLTELVAPLSASIAMRLSYAIAYNNVPEPGFKASDRLLTAGIQLSF
jgi:putative salt-induced outer membrane protein